MTHATAQRIRFLPMYAFQADVMEVHCGGFLQSMTSIQMLRSCI